MKKWLIVILVLLAVLIASVYLLIPNIISVNQALSINANQYGLHRSLFDENNWAKWWPGSPVPVKTGSLGDYDYKGRTYSIDDKKVSSLLISITKKDILAVTSLNFIATGLDSTKLDWEAKMPTSYNPVKRLQAYFRAKQIKEDMQAILEKMQSFFSKQENIYGYEIQKAAVIDTALISTFATSKGYPGTEFIYQLVDQLKNYIITQSAKETGFPMLNISTADSINFITRVAIPIDRILPSSGNISYKWMLGGGNILITEVRGGPASINKAFRQVEFYVNDQQRQPIAIPFLSLVTNRRQETDTSKWITRIYYPVI
jgi:hypothetical protein